jgi:hypothetical protein
MHKLRHIHSKVGSETAFRIPVSVEDAIAEAVEAYDALAARCNRLQEALHHSLQCWSYDGVTPEHGSVFEESNNRCDESSAASLLLHDAGVLEKVVEDRLSLLTDLVTGASGNARVYASKHGSISLAALRFISAQLRKQAAALEGEG